MTMRLRALCLIKRNAKWLLAEERFAGCNAGINKMLMFAGPGADVHHVARCNYLIGR